MILEEIKPSAPPRELLAADATGPLISLADHPVWQSALSGEMDKDRLGRLILSLYPVVAGPGRYLFSAKVSQISPEDGAELFRQLYQADQNDAANSDQGWRLVGGALGIAETTFDQISAHPSAEASDLLEVLRGHSLRSAPATAVAVAWALERQLPALWGQLADALHNHYGIAEESLIHLRYQATRAEAVENWIEHLLQHYFDDATPYDIFEARRAMWEALWAWTALTESVT
jgi:hypothetical protein